MLRFRLPVLIAVALAAILLLGVQSFRWSGVSGARRAHEKFLGYLEGKRWSKCHRRISEAYSDRWQFDREDVSLALQEIGGQFVIVFVVDWDPKGISPTPAAEGFAVSGALRFDGNGSPACALIARESRRLSAEAFEFVWRREGLLPWKWKLIRIDHPSLEPPAGYTPGELGSARSALF